MLFREHVEHIGSYLCLSGFGHVSVSDQGKAPISRGRTRTYSMERARLVNVKIYGSKMTRASPTPGDGLGLMSAWFGSAAERDGRRRDNKGTGAIQRKLSKRGQAWAIVKEDIRSGREWMECSYPRRASRSERGETGGTAWGYLTISKPS